LPTDVCLTVTSLYKTCHVQCSASTRASHTRLTYLLTYKYCQATSKIPGH